jgi:hypothetical protein
VAYAAALSAKNARVWVMMMMTMMVHLSRLLKCSKDFFSFSKQNQEAPQRACVLPRWVFRSGRLDLRGISS